MRRRHRWRAHLHQGDEQQLFQSPPRAPRCAFPPPPHRPPFLPRCSPGASHPPYAL